MLNLKPNERTFTIRPIGIKYICEFCNEGEMIYKNSDPIIMELVNNQPIMHPHVCSKCGKSMLLPKMYPYVEWESDEDDQTNNQQKEE